MVMLSHELRRVFELSDNNSDIYDPILVIINEELDNYVADSHINAIEQLLVTKLSSWNSTSGPIFSYLLRCYSNACNLLKSSEKLMQECRYFIISYAGLILVMPEMFDQSGCKSAELGPGLAAKMMLKDMSAFPSSFLNDLVARFEMEDDTFYDLFSGMFSYICNQARNHDLLMSTHSLFATLETLISFKPVAQLLPKLSFWCPSDLAALSVNETFLGSLFSISTDQPKLLDLVLPNREESSLISSGQTFQAYSTIRMSLASVQSQLHSFLFKLIKVSPEIKESVISFFASVARLNVNRTKMHVDRKTITPDGIIGNMFGVLLKFSEPFLGANNPKADLIDPAYFEISDRLPIDEVTKINMTDAEYSEYKRSFKASHHEAKAPNFISEIFFLTAYFFRLSYICNINSLQMLSRHLNELKSHLGRLQESFPPGTPPAMQQLLVKKFTTQKLEIEDTIRTIEIWSFDEMTIETVYLFVTLILQWLIKQAKASPEGLLPTQPETNFLALPEYFIECVAEWTLFISRVSPQFWVRNGRQLDVLIQFIVTFLDRTEHIKNPYLRSKFIEVLHGWTTGSTEHIFDQYPIMVNHLASKMMRFYVEVERTGTSSQFYDKFNIRYHISIIMKCLWDHGLYRQKIIEAASDRQTFIHFINYLLNDTSYLLDEATSKLADIQKFQNDKESGEVDKLPQEERMTRLQNFEQTERHCISLTQLAGETLNMMAYLTKDIKAPFLQDEVIDHLAAMLNYDLIKLAGPNCRDLKVKDPEKYHFEPREWLGALIRTYLNLSQEQLFLSALARDERSFDPETFEKATRLIGRLGLGNDDDIKCFQSLTQEVILIKNSQTIAEADLGDIPDEYLDPLMFNLMEDPVILTTSGITVDRKTIVAHLLNNQIDPFNRMPITMDQVIPNSQLKAEIDSFLKQKREN